MKINKECVFETTALVSRGRCAYCGLESDSFTCCGLCEQAFDTMVGCLMLSFPPPRNNIYLPPAQLFTPSSREYLEQMKQKEFSSCTGSITSDNKFRFYLNDTEFTSGELELASSSELCVNCGRGRSESGSLLALPGLVLDSFCSPLCRAAMVCFLRRGIIDEGPKCTELYPMHVLGMEDSDYRKFDIVKQRDDYLTKNVPIGDDGEGPAKVYIDISHSR